MTPDDAAWMDRALELAERGWGRVHPNPMVGAVVLDRAGEAAGSGWHAEFGGAHAEVVALGEARERAAGGTLYVTLEPCRHHGRTPPCSQTVIASGVRRVVIAAEDPNPDAAGGADELRAAGIEVVEGLGRDAARDLNGAFFREHERHAPWLALKYALSMDARLSDTPDAPATVTGPLARREVHRLRSGFDAVLVGAGTVRSDDPLLTVREGIQPHRPPVRVVLDTRLEAILPESRLRDTTEAPTWAVHGPEVDAERLLEFEQDGLRAIEVPLAPGGLDLEAALQALYDAGLRSILCEGGGRVGAALLRARLVDRHYVFLAPLLLGPDGAPAYPEVEPVLRGRAWRRIRQRTFGRGLLLELAPPWEERE